MNKTNAPQRIIKADILQVNPIYYNLEKGVFSNNINTLLENGSISIDPEGLAEYLDFGYSVFGLTPFANINFLLPGQCLYEYDYNGSKKLELHEECLDDESFFTSGIEEVEVWDYLESIVRSWEEKTHGPILIPTSGGLDSRILNLLIKDKSRIFAYTYGVSENQSDSHEILIAQEVCRRLGIKWKSIELGKFHQYISEWHNIFGPSVHAHGMYQIEFYTKIRELHCRSSNLLSGIIGDLWAGSFVPRSIRCPDDLLLLSHAHGVVADSRMLLKQPLRIARIGFFEKNRERLQDPRYQILTLVRLKMILLRYLIVVPETLGFNTWSPFLDHTLIKLMLGLKHSRRLHRLWQHDFLSKFNLDMRLFGRNLNLSNLLDLSANRELPLMPLNKMLLKGVIREDYLDWINCNIAKQTYLFSGLQKIIRQASGGLLDRIFLKLYRFNPQLVAYNAYMVLKPLEITFQQSNYTYEYK